MAEYIEREAVEKFIMDGLNNSDVYERFGHDAIKIIAEVHYMPAADVAPVVRCKDCKYGEVDNADFHDQYLCHISGSDWNCGNHFCSYGERKDGDD